MRIGIPKEILEGEKRVAIVPKMVAKLIKEGQGVLVETDAGEAAFFSDTEYEKAGATIIPDARRLYAESDLVMKVQPPQKEEVKTMKPESTFIGMLSPTSKLDIIQEMRGGNITSFAIEYIPRIARAQSMDALSSMSSIAGYRAVLIAANHLGKFFPLLMTAAGTIPPAKVLVIGAGVAGLQAIATARSLGAKVEAFDTRPSVKEQIKSLGAQFIEMELVKDSETSEGYAKEMSDEFLKKEREIIGNRIAENDVIISTAQVFGKKAPVLITAKMVRQMKKGSVIIDLASEQGGNCELTEAGKEIVRHGIIIYGNTNIPSSLPTDASRMYSRNITNLFTHLYKANDGSLDFDDEITKSTCITYKGEVVNVIVRKAFQKGGTDK
ncbi:MAG: Re/Si-specific NAD(P)(+) transhydrogenase subunit alpha [Candidatus Scalinduaceae bacterium]